MCHTPPPAGIAAKARGPSSIITKFGKMKVSCWEPSWHTLTRSLDREDSLLPSQSGLSAGNELTASAMNFCGLRILSGSRQKQRESSVDPRAVIAPLIRSCLKLNKRVTSPRSSFTWTWMLL